MQNSTALCHSSKPNTCCVVQKQRQQHQESGAELSDFGQWQAGQVSDLRLYCQILPYCQFSYNSSTYPYI